MDNMADNIKIVSCIQTIHTWNIFPRPMSIFKFYNSTWCFRKLDGASPVENPNECRS